MSKVTDAIDRVNARIDAVTDGAVEGMSASVLLENSGSLYVGLKVTSQEGRELSEIALRHFFAVISSGQVPVEAAFTGAVKHALVVGCMVGMEDE